MTLYHAYAIDVYGSAIFSARNAASKYCDWMPLPRQLRTFLDAALDPQLDDHVNAYDCINHCI